MKSKVYSMQFGIFKLNESGQLVQIPLPYNVALYHQQEVADYIEQNLEPREVYYLIPCYLAVKPE